MRNRIVAGALVLPAVAGVTSLYRHGQWALGPSAPLEREACVDSGGREGDLFLIHHCAPDPFRESHSR